MTALTIRGVRARPVLVPLRRPLATAGGAVEAAPLVLIDLETADGAGEGPTGSAYVFTYTPTALRATATLVEALGERLRGTSAQPRAIAETMQAWFRLLGGEGLAGMAAAGLDMAAWDAVAKAAGLPLCRLLGAEPAPLPAYNSNGLGIIGAERAAVEAQELVAEGGFFAIKVRLGYPTVVEDLRILEAVGLSVGHEIRLMVDYNQALSLAEAGQRISRLDALGLAWIEEPIARDDYQGYAALSRRAATPIQLGENCWGPRDMARAVAAGAGRVFMPDAMKIGGVTGWLEAAALAETHGLPLSSHLFPEVSTHLLAASPTRHWLEFVDWAAPVLAEPLAVVGGMAAPSTAPGIGIAWDEAAVTRYGG